MNHFIEGLEAIREREDRSFAEAAAKYLDGELFSYKFEGDAKVGRTLIVTLAGSPEEHRFRISRTPDYDTIALIRVTR